MAVTAVVVYELSYAKMVQLGSDPSGPINVFWLRLLANVDRVAKQKLTNQMVTVRTGNLRSSQQVPFVTMRGGTLVGTAQNVAKYAFFVHEGTRPHEIRAVNKRVLTGWMYGDGPVFTPIVHHPGTVGRPWLREALHEVITTMA